MNLAGAQASEWQPRSLSLTKYATCPRHVSRHAARRGQSPITTTVAALRIVARVVHQQGDARGLVGFGTADDHLHAALVTDRSSAGAFARCAATALRWQPHACDVAAYESDVASL